MIGIKDNKRLIGRWYDRSGSGSITVEAAFIMPMILFIISALIFLSFYLYDICRIQGTMDKIVYRAGMMVKHEAELREGEILFEKINDRGIYFLVFGSTDKEEQQIYQYLEDELSKGLFLTRVKEIEVDYNKRKISVTVLSETLLTLNGYPAYFNRLTGKTFTTDISVHDPAETIRRTEVILDSAARIKGVDELKEKIEKFLKRK